MCFFFKRKNLAKEKTNEDRSLIDVNYKSIETLIVLSTDKEFTDELKKMQEQLKYLIPSADDKVYEYDKKIKNGIGDLKICLTKDGDAKNSVRAKQSIQNIKVLIAERNALV